MKLITIVTPSYNRVRTLPALYDSLLQQTSTNFVWMVIDDGSLDTTAGYMENVVNDSPLEIVYVRKENGGKHTALNIAIEKVKTDLFFIVDSDDVLTSDAIETIETDWVKANNGNLCGLGYLRGYNEKNVIGDAYPVDGAYDNFINLRYNQRVSGDKAEVWVTELLRQYGGFPECQGERFVSESVLWIKVSRKHDMFFRNKIIYITEYLPGGLSDTGRALRFRCPELMAYGSLETMTSDFSFKNRVKQALLLIVYSKFGKKGFSDIISLNCKLKGRHGEDYRYPVFSAKDRIINRCMIAFCYLPGIVLYKYWKKKFMK